MVRTRDLHGVERVVAPSRIYWAGCVGLAGIDALSGYWADVQARAATCDLAMAWDLLAEEREELDVPIAELASLTPGGEEPVDLDALVVAVFRDAKWFKLRKGVMQRAKRSAIEAHDLQVERDAARSARQTVAVDAMRLRLDAPGATLVPEQEEAFREFVVALVDAAVHGKESDLRAQAESVIGRVDPGGKGGLALRAFSVLVRLGEFGPDENLHVRRADLRRAFPASVIEAASQAQQPGHIHDVTVDRTDLLTVAIDDAQTTEVDDAFAIVGDRLLVFIADAAAFVTPGSVLDREAAGRGATVYLPEGKIPMLPAAISEDASSLVEGADRSALCFSMGVGPDGAPTDFQVELSRCRVDRRLTYDEVDGILASPAPEEPVDRIVSLAAEWMDLHRAHRRRAGAVFIQRREVEIVVGASGSVDVRPLDANGPGRSLVSEMMVATCAATANWCVEKGIPTVFRAQPQPDEAFEHEGEIIADPVRQVSMLRRLKPAVLTSHAAPHHTLGVEAYAQVTSPLRRYADLLMHQQIRGALLHQGAPHGAEDLMGFFASLERLTAAQKQVARSTRRTWMLRYLADNPDQTWSALVIRPLSRRWLVLLEDLAMQTPLAASRKIEAGDRFGVRVVRVDPSQDVLVLEEVTGAT